MNRLYFFYLNFIGFSWIFFYVYFYFIRKRVSFEIKGEASIELKILFLTIFFAYLISFYLALKDIFERENKSKFWMKAFTNLFAFLYEKPLHFIYETYYQKIPKMAEIISFAGEKFLNFEKKYPFPVIFFIEFLPRILLSFVFFVDIVLMNQIFFFIPVIFFFGIHLFLWKIFFFLWQDFVKLNLESWNSLFVLEDIDETKGYLTLTRKGEEYLKETGKPFVPQTFYAQTTYYYYLYERGQKIEKEKYFFFKWLNPFLLLFFVVSWFKIIIIRFGFFLPNWIPILLFLFSFFFLLHLVLLFFLMKREKK